MCSNFGHALFCNKRMSKENLNQFCLLVLSDLNLQNQLKDLIDHENFVARIIELGANAGFEIVREEIDWQLLENRHLWHKRWI